MCLAPLATSCSKPPPDPNIAIYQKQLEQGSKRLTEIDAEIKTSHGDSNLAAALNEDKRLLQSRLERIKEHLILLGALAPATAEGGGGGGGGAHH